MAFVLIATALILNVLVHELAHICAARLTRLPVARVQFGFGPELACYKGRFQTRWSFRAIPLGGALEFGETPNKEIQKLAFVLIAGPAANLLLGVALYLTAFYLSPIHNPAVLDGSRSFELYLFAYLSIAFGLSNLLPMPPLDGANLILLGLRALGALSDSQDALIRQSTAKLLAATMLLSFALGVAWIATSLN